MTMKDDEESNIQVQWRNAETCVELYERSYNDN